MSSAIGLFFNEANKVDLDPERVAARVEKWQKEQPGYFTPYKNTGDFFETLTNPVTKPIICGLISGVLAVGVVVTSAACIATLAVGSMTALFGKSDTAHSSFELAGAAAIMAGICTLVSICLAVGMLLALISESAKLVTRTGASIVSPIVDLFTSIKHNDTANNTLYDALDLITYDDECSYAPAYGM
ncbi:MAG: hypothetical protein PSV35_02030 [bacterium]|nr:hypothetical protein [bacterium]